VQSRAHASHAWPSRNRECQNVLICAAASPLGTKRLHRFLPKIPATAPQLTIQWHKSMTMTESHTASKRLVMHATPTHPCTCTDKPHSALTPACRYPSLTIGTRGLSQSSRGNQAPSTSCSTGTAAVMITGNSHYSQALEHVTERQPPLPLPLNQPMGNDQQLVLSAPRPLRIVR